MSSPARRARGAAQETCCPQHLQPWCVTLRSCKATWGQLWLSTSGSPGMPQAELPQLKKHMNPLVAVLWARVTSGHWSRGCWLLPAPLPPAWGPGEEQTVRNSETRGYL